MAAAGAPHQGAGRGGVAGSSTLSRQGYYQWLKDPVCQRDYDDAHLIDKSSTTSTPTTPRWATASSPTSSTDEHGITVGENRVHRLCRIAGIHRQPPQEALQGQESTGPAPHDDLLAVVDEHGVVRHEFIADVPNKVWLWDISEHPTREGKLYICAIKDVFSNKIVGYSIDSRMKSSAWRGPRCATRSPCAHRSPRSVTPTGGGQFRAKKPPSGCSTNNDLVGSMGRSYGAGDNASMESFFSLLRKNVLNTRRWDTREDLRLAIVTWIESKYNRRRRQRALGRLTPIEFEMIYTTAEAA